MAQVKLTKTELRVQQDKFAQLEKYLPTLQLKKALLQAEINQALSEVEALQKELFKQEGTLEKSASLFSERGIESLFSAVIVKELSISHENVAGVDIPLLDKVVFQEADYSLFDTPIWYESAILQVRELLICKEKVKIAEQKKAALEKELREVSIRVNLFEKVMIPRAIENIKKIKIFLGDQQLASVSQSKVAKK